MKHFMRPYQGIGILVVMGMIAGARSGPAQSTQIVELLPGTSPLLLHSSSSQGYLGAYVEDVDNDKAQALKLKEVRGAVITLIDHDAPAGQIGLRVNDVVLQLNGQNVEGAEQLRRMLREIPPGRKVSLEFSRDGNLQTTSVELADRHKMETEVWNKLGNNGDVFVAQNPGMGVLAGGGDGSLPGMFHMPIFGSTLNVGAMVEPLTAQTADFLGVPNGLMVKQVAHKSDAASAGFKAHDVILKVGNDPIVTLSDWDRALRSNQGKTVQITILREGKQQTLTLQVDSKHKSGALELEELFPTGDSQLLAELDQNAAQIFGQDDQTAKAMREQAEELRRQAEKLGDSFKAEDFKIDPKSMDELKQQMEEFRKNFKAQDFQIDPQQAEQFRKQAEQLRDQLKLDDLKIDPKSMDELKQQMEEFRKNFKMDDFKLDQKQLDEMKQRMDEFRKSFNPQDLQDDPV
jgi:membrane-associated protease RseP (regulator of RpoE activity)